MTNLLYKSGDYTDLNEKSLYLDMDYCKNSMFFINNKAFYGRDVILTCRDDRYVIKNFSTNSFCVIMEQYEGDEYQTVTVRNSSILFKKAYTYDNLDSDYFRMYVKADRSEETVKSSCTLEYEKNKDMFAEISSDILYLNVPEKKGFNSCQITNERFVNKDLLISVDYYQFMIETNTDEDLIIIFNSNEDGSHSLEITTPDYIVLLDEKLYLVENLTITIEAL